MSNTVQRRLARGAAKKIQKVFGLKSSTAIWRVMDSGGIGLGIDTDASGLYEYMWQHRHSIFTADYLPTFIENDKTHQS